MYTREHASQLRQEFWTTFGRYMQPLLSADSEKINWVNYKTGEKNLLFKMEADQKKTTIAIVLNHPYQELRHLYFEQLEQLKTTLHEALGEPWNWQQEVYTDNGKRISTVSTSLEDVNLFNKNDWPAIISFLKPRLIALDEWWSMARYSFESLH